MDNQRAIALLIAVAAAMLVVLAGKSCMKSIEEQNKKTESSSTAVQTSQTTADIPSTVVKAPTIVTAESSIEYETDFFGDIVGTVPPTEAPSGEEPAETSTKSMLDEFWDREHPNYIDPYGSSGGKETPSVVEIEIG
jgi:hypothetical protein